MRLSSKIVAFLLAAIISLVTVLFTSLVPNTPQLSLLMAGLLTFGSSFFLIYITVEYLVFKEINTLYAHLEKVKKKNFKKLRRNRAVLMTVEPVERISDMLFSFAREKEAEIDELKRIENYRREFFADISHELKTPIFSAQGFIETLLDGAIDDVQVREQFLIKANKALDHLNHIVQDLLLLSKLEAGVIRIEAEPMELNEFIKDVFGQLEQKAHNKQIKLELLCNETECWVKADPQRIRQVFVNLVHNAIKYGKQHGRVQVLLVNDRKTVNVTITDDGPGIPEQSLTRIFERFYRVEKSRAKKLGGSGLGLAIVKQVVEAHGYKIQATSTLGAGTSFSFRLKKLKNKTDEEQNDDEELLQEAT